MENNQDVGKEDLYAELKKSLESDEPVDGKPPVASDQKPKDDVDALKKPVDTKEDENAELSEEDITKLSPRAQKRIREQAEEIKRLADKAEKSPESPKPEDKTSPSSFKNVDEFLAAVQDEPSRNLLQKFAEVLKAENKAILEPIEQKNNEARFENEFAQFEKIEGLADYKSDLRKTFLRNPNQSLKSLVGEVVTDLQMNKIKPIESDPSIAKRGPADLSNLSKDELYAELDKMKG